MLAPDRLAGRSAIDAKDVVRVALEPRGIIGFIQIPSLESHAMTLAEARTIIAATIDHVPDDVQFLYGDAGLPIGRAQEPYHHVADHYPCIKLRPAPSIAKKLKPTTYQISVTHGQTKSLFVSWIPSTYTFQQLRRDAARYWDVPHDAATLVDQDGCAWPDEASIASTLLENDVLAAKTRLVLRHKKLSHGPTIVASRLRVPTKNLDERLWYIFTFYCVHGDALDVLGMTAYQFHRFLRDCRLFSSAFTPAMGDVIYAFEAKGKLAKPLAASRRATAKLDYDGFLNALATMATRRYANDALPTLLSTHVLPRASSWPLHTWQFHTSLLQQDDVARFVLKFEPMLRDIFVFYTNQPFSEAEVESTMAFSDYVRFVNDFHITELLLSTHECPELFLASCQCTGRRDTMHFDAFLDVLGRAGLVGLTRYRPLQPLQCVKAVFHHMTRGLKSSRALEIIANHGPSALYAARFYAGCVAFSHKFLDVWRIEGSPDYITGVLPILPDKSTHGRDMLAQMMVHAEAAPVAPLPPPGRPHGGAATFGACYENDDPDEGQNACDASRSTTVGDSPRPST
ncbi:hypothetical protein SPRG_02735 [Saprolegnia parasitica CBS 223.65]|uniref:Uncharacterized protein n=1 Tax=Saprolegnia parasitica (strain CBS 223.65) TaxID=695850 RepID=A0A067D0I0_SAPPC|nr:hypothetical protein SPRG_02735 [Saprolegnia parasitica CBS 223.65]KDO32256.1 hypothetical protein SPRG_02735 [Saprolegnia parasitica CBS 223.65]|eukprot:XP_012196712.1 hypothetical protein SPRG_02735 [Saprolegnia parasitica CBS 223.65]